ncbi:MAG TPA: hypothetical protein VF266_20355 [Thermoanaerobaculia bacterium]
MKWLKWFIAGTLAVPLGHQIALWMLNAAGMIDRAPFNMDPTRPFGIPSVISLSFWGGVWGILLGLILIRARGATFWWIALIVGAIAPTLVAGLVVAPLKGMKGGATPTLFAVGLIVNAVWGVMTAAFYRLMQRE